MEDLSPQLKEIIADLVFQVAHLRQQVLAKDKQIASLGAKLESVGVDPGTEFD